MENFLEEVCFLLGLSEGWIQTDWREGSKERRHSVSAIGIPLQYRAGWGL